MLGKTALFFFSLSFSFRGNYIQLIVRRLRGVLFGGFKLFPIDFNAGTPTESILDTGMVAMALHYSVSRRCHGHGYKATRKGLGCGTVIGKREINPSLSVASLLPSVPGKGHLLSAPEGQVDAGVREPRRDGRGPQRL